MEQLAQRTKKISRMLSASLNSWPLCKLIWFSGSSLDWRSQEGTRSCQCHIRVKEVTLQVAATNIDKASKPWISINLSKHLLRLGLKSTVCLCRATKYRPSMPWSPTRLLNWISRFRRQTEEWIPMLRTRSKSCLKSCKTRALSTCSASCIRQCFRFTSITRTVACRWTLRVSRSSASTLESSLTSYLSPRSTGSSRHWQTFTKRQSCLDSCPLRTKWSQGDASWVPQRTKPTLHWRTDHSSATMCEWHQPITNRQNSRQPIRTT